MRTSAAIEKNDSAKLKRGGRIRTFTLKSGEAGVKLAKDRASKEQDRVAFADLVVEETTKLTRKRIEDIKERVSVTRRSKSK